MKLLRALLALSTGFALPLARAADPAPPPSDERMDKLEQRVDKIDRSLDQILLLLQNQQAAPARAVAPLPPEVASGIPAPAPTPAATAETDASLSLAPMPVATALKPGVLLDVWLRPTGYRGGVPSGPSLVTLRDTRGPCFQLGRHTEEKELATNVGKPLVQVWRCYLNIKTAGTYSLIAESRRTTDRRVVKDQVWDDYKFEWRAQLTLNEKVLLDETNRFESVGKGALSRPFTLNLTPGYYAVQLVTWLPEHAASEVYDYKPLTFALRLREPGALKPRDLASGDFLCRE